MARATQAAQPSLCYRTRMEPLENAGETQISRADALTMIVNVATWRALSAGQRKPHSSPSRQVRSGPGS